MKNIVSLLVIAVVVLFVNNVFAQEAAPAAPAAPAANAAPVAPAAPSAPAAPAASVPVSEEQAAQDAEVTEAPSWLEQYQAAEVKTMPSAFTAFFTWALLYAGYLAFTHFLGTFIDPTAGLVFAVVGVVWAVGDIGLYYYAGAETYATIKLLCLATAGYFHFTKTLAVA